MGSVMMTVELPPGAVSLAEAADRLGLDPGALDAEYGLVELDPGNNLYAVLVDEAAGVQASGREGVEGPFSNPRIEPFWPPKPG